MKKLKPGIDPVALMKAVKQCDGDVFFLTKNDQLDLKSVLSQYVFISLLAHTSPESSRCFLWGAPAFYLCEKWNLFANLFLFF